MMHLPFISKFLEKIKLDRLRQQKAFFYAGAAFVLFLTFGVYYLLTRPDVPEKQVAVKKPKITKIANGAQNIKDEEHWVYKIEKVLASLQKQMDQHETILKGLAGHQMAQNSQKLSDSDSPADGNSSPSNHLGSVPVDDITQARQQLAMSQKTSQDGISKGAILFNALPSSQKPPSKPEIKKISFQQDPRNSKRIAKSIDHYVPAGSFARGVLTSGVIASTSVGSSANPQPIHIQLTNYGNLPRRFRTDIKECFVIGSSYGDLASERVFMRLEKLSCVERKTGEVIELTVDGYVTGEDGANGIRGILVDRSGPAMRNAFIGGFVGGMGNFFSSQQATPLSIVGGGIANINPMTSQHLLQAGAGKGVGNAMEKFADFYVKRAEQLQPVLEVEPGRVLDIVFKSGFDMAQTVYRRALMMDNDRERRELVATGRSSITGNNQPNTQGGFYASTDTRVADTSVGDTSIGNTSVGDTHAPDQQ